MAEELTVLSKAKELTACVFTITMNAPKRFRFTLSSRMQNLCLEVVGRLYAANDVWVHEEMPERGKRLQQRLDFQHEALSRLRELDWLLSFSRSSGAILPKQQAQAAGLLEELGRMIRGWIRGDRRKWDH